MSVLLVNKRIKKIVEALGLHHERIEGIKRRRNADPLIQSAGRLSQEEDVR